MVDADGFSRVSWLGLVERIAAEASRRVVRYGDDVMARVSLLQDNSSLQRHVATQAHEVVDRKGRHTTPSIRERPRRSTAGRSLVAG